MDHVVYLDTKANELEKLLSGGKTMLIRGAAGRKMPYGRVNCNDVLYLLNNNAEGFVHARAVVTSVLNSEALTPDASRQWVQDHQQQLQLTGQQQKRWSGKRYLVLIEVSDVEEISPFAINKDAYSNMDDWLPVGDIETVRETKRGS